MKQFPRPMLEELYFRNPPRDALAAAEFPEGPQKAREPVRDYLNDMVLDAPQKDPGKPLLDPMKQCVTAARIAALLGPTDADFFSQMSSMEARSLADLRQEAGARQPGQGSISRAQAGGMRAVPQEQWDRVQQVLQHTIQDLQEAKATFHRYEALHWAKGTPESAEKAAANARHARRMFDAINRIQGVLS